MKVVRVPGDGAEILAVALKNLENKVGKVGWFENSRYPEAPHVPVAYVATIHEFGYPAGNIPPRPFMRPTIANKRAEWRQIAEQGSRAVFAGKATVYDVLEAIGLKAAGDVRKTISLIQSPPLADSTVAARRAKRSDKKTTGSLTKPLVDTGLLLATLTNTVEDEA